MRPSEVVVLAVEDLLGSSSLVVVLYDLLIGHVPVVGQYTAVCVLAVEDVKLLSLLLALPLHDEAAMLYVLETLEGERLHVVLLESYLHRSPACLPLHLLVQTCIPLGTDVELFRMQSECCEVLSVSLSQRKEYGQICPKRKIFRQKR